MTATMESLESAKISFTGKAPGDFARELKSRGDKYFMSRNLSPYAKSFVIADITTDQIARGQSLIMTEVTYDYTSPLGNFLPGMTQFTDTFYHHPRSGAAVKRTS